MRRMYRSGCCWHSSICSGPVQRPGLNCRSTAGQASGTCVAAQDERLINFRQRAQCTFLQVGSSSEHYVSMFSHAVCLQLCYSICNACKREVQELGVVSQSYLSQCREERCACRLQRAHVACRQLAGDQRQQLLWQPQQAGVRAIVSTTRPHVGAMLSPNSES